MKQILQNLKNGETKVVDIPVPYVNRGQLLIKTSNTLVSAGTERMLVEFGKAGWVDKARQQPDKVRLVLDKVKTDGLIPTLDAVFNKLNQPLPLGYCNVGRVAAVGSGVVGFGIGDRVISNGNHAEYVSVPINLCARVPDVVSDDEAAFAVLAAIALQGVRLVQPTLGESVVVTGLGLVGLMTVQLLRANGCRVMGLDFDPEKLNLARKFGAEVVDLSAHQDPVAAAHMFSRGRGVDAVLVTASTKSSEPIHQAALMCRKRGRIVLVGVTGLELSRDDFFKKELTFQVSASYGPGRYDPNYEEKGQDYPVGFVRWTEQRNFEAVLDMMASGRLDVKPLISHRFAIAQAEQVYQLISSAEASLGILLTYPMDVLSSNSSSVILRSSPEAIRASGQFPSVSFIGAGNYATALLMPAFKAAGAHLQCVVSNGGVSGVHAGRKYGFVETSTDTQRVFRDDSTHVVVVTTRHNSHAAYVIKALQARKHVFVEKPLCLNVEELSAIEAIFSNDQTTPVQSLLMVGFNRRFAPQIQTIKRLLDSAVGPKSFLMTVNAGAVPEDHWTQDKEVGGGRVVGEACHFIDLLRFLSGSPIASFGRTALPGKTVDSVSISLTFEDGSIGTIHYFANGSKTFPKERLEVFAQGRVLQLDNFRRLKGYGWPGFKQMNLWRQDKGQKACVLAFMQAVSSGLPSPIPLDEILEVSRITLEIGGENS